MTIPEDLTEWRKDVEEEQHMVGSAWVEVHPVYRQRSDRLLALIDEVERLRLVEGERDVLRRRQSKWAEWRADVLKVLRDIELNWQKDHIEFCPACSSAGSDHAPDCALAAVLRGESE